jgi:hypothetical protein
MEIVRGNPLEFSGRGNGFALTGNISCLIVEALSLEDEGGNPNCHFGLVGCLF